METPAIPSRGSLARKLAKILGEIGAVQKRGRNAFHKYDYVTETDLVYAVRGKLSEAGVFVFTSVESQHAEIIETGSGGKSLLTTVVTKHTFVDGESGEEFTVLSQGQGSDNGDKGGYKAITGAMKYFLYKCFMIPTGDDPEGDDKTDKRGAKGTSTATPIQTAKADAIVASAPRVQTLKDYRPEYAGERWRDLVIHFGSNYKGMQLGELTTGQLKNWFSWKPPAINGVLSEADQRLRAALDVAQTEAK